MQRATINHLWSFTRRWSLALMSCVLANATQVAAQPTNDNFANAQVISGEWGSLIADNLGATSQTGEPSHAGFPAVSSIWYSWVAPHDGEVTFDTLGTEFSDTVLAVYTGTNLSFFSQVAANDDFFPLTSSPQINYSGSGDYAAYSGPGGLPVFGYYQSHYGPSGVRFNAKGGATYYVAVDTKLGGNSPFILLNWAYKASGVFRFATEDQDFWTGMPLYQCAQTESSALNGTANDVNSAILTYYTYNVPGVLVTVTRVGGASGRVAVDYTTVDGEASPFFFGYDRPAYAFYTNITVFTNLDGSFNSGTTNVIAGDYVPTSGKLIFDDFEMSKTIRIPINPFSSYLDNPIITTRLAGSSPPPAFAFGNNNLSNTVFGIALSNPRRDDLEALDVSDPRLDPQFSTAMVKILNVRADPYGPNSIEQITTNLLVDPIALTTNESYFTNFVTIPPTNAIFNFSKANYRVPGDVNDTNSPWTTVSIYVSRYGTNRDSVTLNYRINNELGYSKNNLEEQNIYFPLQPGSDYAVPTPATWSPIRGVNPDFDLAQGTLNFPGGNNFDPQKITFTVPTSSLTKFNKDFKIQLYRIVQVGGRDTPVLVGMVNEATVTILFNDLNPPAGSVDQLYNADFNSTLALPPDQVPQTYPNNNNTHPGVAGQVYGLATLTNNQTILVGDFVSYNGYSQGSITRVNADGSPDLSFNTGTGANAAINAVGVTPDGGQYIIGGIFTSFNGSGVNGVARLNSNGSTDSSFMPAVNGPVRSILVQPDGKVVIGGDFTEVNGVTRKYIARLNTDGSVDPDFDAGNALDGSVYALAIPRPFTVNAGRQAAGGTDEDVQIVNFAPATSGTLQVNYDMAGVPDEMRIFYGTTNSAPIFDSGMVSGFHTVNIPFGPINGLKTNVLIIVMNQGGGNQGTVWFYDATVTISPNVSDGIVAGGLFNVAGKPYKNIAMLSSVDGSLSSTFNPGTGPDNKVLALAWQLNGQVVAGGSFTHVNGNSYNHIVRLNQNGSIDTTNFFVGTGADNVVYSISLQLDGTMYVGGAFSSFNGTHRLGFARLYSNGTVDTTFLDTAYNQFAGLKRVYTWDSPAVFTSAVQPDGNVLIGGAFEQVGGGQANTNVCNALDLEFGYEPSFGDTNLWVEPKTRDGVRNRSGFARLIGGATPGPGNIGLRLSSYSANKSQSLLSVGLVRTNGMLGPVSANFSVQSGLAVSGRDYVYNSPPPIYWLGSQYITHPTRVRSDGLAGPSGFLVDPYGLALGNADLLINNQSAVTLSIIKNSASAGNLNAQFQLQNPSCMDNFYLGGQNIPIGAALGISSAPVTLVDDTQQPGVFGFSSPVFVATNANALITVLRSNGVFGNVSMRYSTSNGTAVVVNDYTGITNQLLLFNQNVISNGFTVSVKNNGFIYTNSQEKTVNLVLSSLAITPGATFGISNAVLRLINPNFQGYLTFSTNNFSGLQSAGVLKFIVNRVAGSLGTLSVQYATTNGTAINGVDYVGSTNTLSWNSGDVGPKTISIPLLNNGIVGGNRQFAVSLFNSTLNGTNTPSLMGSFSNAVLNIINDNNYGTLQFSAASYNVNENGGYATITVNRTGGAAGSVSVNYAASNGSNTVAGVNFVPTSGTLIFTTNQLSASFTVPILSDGAVNPLDAFNFQVSLFNPTNAALGTLTNAVVNILDANSFIRPPGSPDTQFDPNTTFNGSVFTLALQSDGRIVVGGNYTAVGTSVRNRIARLNTDGSLDNIFLNGSPGANGPVLSVVSQTDDRILIAGSFTSINGVFRNYIARLMTDGTLDTSFNPGAGADNTVNVLAEAFVGANRKIYVGGMFGNVNSTLSPGLIRLNNDGSADPSFAVGAGADGGVNAIAPYSTNSLYAGKVLVGGSFTHFNGTAANRLLRLNADGSVDATFNSNLGFGASGSVNAIALQADGRAVVGGSFTNFNGTVLNRIVRLNPDGTIDASFVTQIGAGFNDSIKAIAVQPDNRIVVVGQFTQANGVTRSRITRLLSTGATDPTINFGAGANEDVNALVIQPDGMLVIGGGFSQYDNQPHEKIARIYGGSVTGSGAFSFTSANFQATEIGGFGFITVRRVGGTSGGNPDGTGDITVKFVTQNGSAIAGVNYTAVTNTLVFPPGEVLKTVAIPVFDDFMVTPDLTVNLILSEALPPSGFGDQSTAVLTILNSDTSVSLSASTYSVLNNTSHGGADITIVRQGGSSGSASVNFTTTSGTAVAGVDYTPTNGTISFAPGEVSKIVKVPVLFSGQPRGNRTVNFALSAPVDTLLASPSNAVLTIIDTVVAPGQFSFESAAYNASENNSSLLITVLRTNGSSGSVSVNYATVPGTAISGINYQSASNTLNFADGQTSKSFSIDLVDNVLVQGPVSFSVVLSNPTAGATLGSPTSASVTIADNDFPLSVIPAGSALVTESNPNGVLDPNENVTMAFAFRVNTGTNIPNLTATLLATNGIVSPSPVSQNYGAMTVSGPSATRTFSFSVNPAYTNGQMVSATFQLQVNGTSVGTAQFDIVLGTSTKTFSNTNVIVLNDNGSASPYPSAINVSGVGNSLTKATLTLNGFKHSYPQDVDALVRAPSQQSVLFMNNAGSSTAANNLNLTFDDAAGSALPQAALGSGTYKPSVYNPITVFPASAPSGPYATNLSTFNGSNPNGTWLLFMIDDSAANSGAVSNGWSLTLSTLAVLSSAADVGVSITGSNSVVAGASVSYVIAVTNYGPSASSGVNVTNFLPVGFNFVSASASQGSAVTNNGSVLWNVGSLALDAGAKLTVTGTMTSTGSKAAYVGVSASVSDPNPADDSASFFFTVTSAQSPQVAANLVGGSGPFQLNVTGAAVGTVIQASTNLINWVPVYTNTPPFIFSDSTTNRPYRFYRAMLAQ